MALSVPQLIHPLLDGFVMGDPISDHHGVRCCPAMALATEEKYIVKVISIPASSRQLDALLLSGAYSSREDALAYFGQLADGTIAEAELLKRLSELEGFAPYTDWQLVPMEDGGGFDLYLLSPYRMTLERRFRQDSMTHLGAVNLGLDLCAALTVCRRSGHLYVDLKPGNIFITDNGEYRIGDLGFISLSSLKYASLPDKYRSPYTPPEIEDAYSSLNDTMDIYAAGLILYQAFNNHELPLAPAPGESIQPPAYADYEMAEIILKACAADPAQRWEDPVQMGQALVSYLQRNTVNDTPIIPPAVPESAASAEEPESVEELESREATDIFAENPEEIPEESEPAEEMAVQEPVVTEEIPSEESDPGTADETEASDTQSDDCQVPDDDSEGIQEAETEPEQFVIAGFDMDETTPDEETAEGLEDAPVSEEVSQMLAQADDLIAHEAPAPVVAPEPIVVPMPPRILPEEPEQQTDSEPEPTDDSPAEDLTTDTDSSVAVAAAEAGDTEDTEVPAPVKPKSSRRYTGVIAALSAILVLLLLAIGAFVFYEEYYLQTIDNITLRGEENNLSVILDTETDNELLTIVCTDTYGNTLTAPVVNNQAQFQDLRPGTKYTVTVRIDGFHQLIGTTASSYTTAQQTNIVSFTAVTGDQDGSVILNFSVQGPENTAWQVQYSAPRIPEKTVPCTGHMAIITGLEVGTTYTFRLVSTADLYVVGSDTLEHTASKVIRPENLQILGFHSGILKLDWNAPEDTAVESWTVRCYNTDGFDTTITVTDTAAEFEGLDLSKRYTIDVKALGMSEMGQVTVASNSITFHQFTADTSVTGQITVSWEYEGSTPENWMLLYSMDGSDLQVVDLPGENSSYTFSNIVPGAHYTLTIQTSPGGSYFGGETEFQAPDATGFDAYSVTASDMTFQMCITPDKAGWTRYDVPKKNYVTQFSKGTKASFVVKLDKNPGKSSDEVSTLFVIRDSEGKPVLIHSHSRVWNTMWRNRYCQIEMPVMPGEAGSYTVEIYFDGALAHTQAFTVV